MLKGIIRNISTKKARKSIANVIVKAYDIAIETAIIFIAATVGFASIEGVTIVGNATLAAATFAAASELLHIGFSYLMRNVRKSGFIVAAATAATVLYIVSFVLVPFAGVGYTFDSGTTAIAASVAVLEAAQAVSDTINKDDENEKK